MNLPLRQYGQLLARYLQPQRPQVMLLAGLLFGSIGLQLLNPQVIRYFIDTAQSGGAQSALLLAAALYIGFSLTQRGVALWADYVAQNVGWRATNGLRHDLAMHCLRLDMSFHKTHTPGELIERIDGDVTSLANFFSQFSLHVLGNAVLVAGILTLLFREDWRVGVGLAGYSLFLLVSLFAVQRIAVTRWKAARQARAEMYGYLEERISGADDLRAAGAERYALHRLFALMRAAMERGRAAFVTDNLVFGLVNLLFITGYAAGLGVGIYLYSQGQATIGTAYLIVSYVAMLSTPLHRLREQVQDLQQATASIQRVNELLDLKPQVQDSVSMSSHPSSPVPAHHPLPGSSPLSVEFRNVAFAYEGNGNVLHDVSFHLQPGQALGVLGRTGSGKTTLTRLLFRLYDPAGGLIRLSQVEVREASLSELRSRVGLVTQDVQLFQASVRDNLTFFNSRIGDDQIERALKELRLWEWVRSMPEGLNTRLGMGGRGLSAGEAQLLAFTRVFLKDPGLVILDEASSRLDPATESLLERAIDRLFANRTAIIIAHRLQTVQRADDILILEAGRVVEHGPRAALANDPNSSFYNLLQKGLVEALA
jgi:ABC-type multidrug transport system fused ATPase/permease subunit